MESKSQTVRCLATMEVGVGGKQTHKQQVDLLIIRLFVQNKKM
jgi:hypothetical protein